MHRRQAPLINGVCVFGCEWDRDRERGGVSKEALVKHIIILFLRAREHHFKKMHQNRSRSQI